LQKFDVYYFKTSAPQNGAIYARRVVSENGSNIYTVEAQRTVTRKGTHSAKEDNDA